MYIFFATTYILSRIYQYRYLVFLWGVVSNQLFRENFDWRYNLCHAFRCMYVCLQNYQGEIILPDGITLLETTNMHILANHLYSKCSGSILFSEVVVLTLWTFYYLLLLNWTLWKIIVPPNTPFEYCVCAPLYVFVLYVNHCVFWHGPSQQEGSRAEAAFILCYTLTTFLFYDNSET